MSASSASTAGSALPVSAFPGRWLAAPLGCLFLIQFILVTFELLPVQHGVLADPDSYMRLNRVLELERFGDWSDPRSERINPPDGHVQHWTRPLDAILWIGARLLEPALGFKRALYLCGVLISPICLGLAMVALAWCCGPLLPAKAILIACLALPLQLVVLAYGSVGRADHHTMMLLLCTLLMGQTIRLLAPVHPATGAGLGGVIAAFAVWTSAEALLFVAIALSALGFSWLVHGNLGGANRRFSLALAGSAGLFWLIERGGGQLFAVENDRLSVLHVTMFTLIALFWQAADRMAYPKPPWHEDRLEGSSPQGHALCLSKSPALWRLALTLIGLTCILASLLLLFPDLVDGPLGRVDPLYQRARLDKIAEIQPLVQPAWLDDGAIGPALNRISLVLGPSLVAVAWMLARFVAAPARDRMAWLPVGLGLLVYLPLAFYQVRWAAYAELFAVIPYAAAVAAAGQWIEPRTTPLLARWIQALMLLVALLWPWSASSLLPSPPLAKLIDQSCPIASLAPELDRLDNGPPKTIMTLADHGPQLLYQTRHNVLSIPNHRPQPGFRATYMSMTSTNDATAEAIMRRHGVDWILLCPSDVERDLFGVHPDDANRLYNRLAAQKPPPWLRRVPLPDGQQPALLYQRLAPQSSAGATSLRVQHDQR